MTVLACLKDDLTVSEWEMLNFRNEYEIKTFGPLVIINAVFDFYLKSIAPKTLSKFKDIEQFMTAEPVAVVVEWEHPTHERNIRVDILNFDIEPGTKLIVSGMTQ